MIVAPGKLITIEGTEGAGKSTAINYIRQFLSTLACDVLFTREPGGTELQKKFVKYYCSQLARKKCVLKRNYF